MPITRKFRETVWARAQNDARFRAAMLTEAINELLAGDLSTGKAMLCWAWTPECRERRTRTTAWMQEVEQRREQLPKSGRDYVNATITFERLATQTGLPAKSLQRMLGPRGNPTAESLFAIIKVLQKAERITLAVKPTRHAA